jgi:hypothetical protein
MNVRRRTLMVAVAVSVAGSSASAQTQLTGRVVDASGQPIIGATVTLTSIRYSVRTDNEGRFRFAGTPGSTMNLSLQAPGFRDDTASVVLPRSRTVSKDFVMTPEGTPDAEPTGQMLRVKVTSSEGEPLAYANLQVNGGRRYVSDDSGRLQMPVNITRRASLVSRRIGFEATETILTAMPDSVLRVVMRPVARTLDAQVVTVRSPFVRLDLGGFYKRMAEVQNGSRVGYFMTPEDLAIRRPQSMTDAVEHFPNIRLAPIDDGRVECYGTTCIAHADGMMSRRKFRIEDRNGCPMTVYLDRVRIQPASSNLQAVDEEVNSLVNPATIAGIEVYPRHMGAPAEFPAVNSSSFVECGVVVIWTK